jgi:hypothetical protein
MLGVTATAGVEDTAGITGVARRGTTGITAGIGVTIMAGTTTGAIVDGTTMGTANMGGIIRRTLMATPMLIRAAETITPPITLAIITDPRRREAMARG